jgi:hypothetical protein
MEAIFDMCVWTSVERDRRKPFSLKVRDTIQEAGLLWGKYDVPHAKFSPLFLWRENTITFISINALRR